MPQAPSSQPSAHRRERGFTLIEIMAVVVIMAMLMAVVGVNVKNQMDKARVNTAKAQITKLEQQLEFYRMDNGRYPTTAQGLDALLNKPSGNPEPRNYPPGGYLRKSDEILDPWGEPFQFESPGTRNQHAFDLWSLGADGQDGGEGIDAEIGNWDTSRQGQ